LGRFAVFRFGIALPALGVGKRRARYGRRQAAGGIGGKHRGKAGGRVRHGENSSPTFSFPSRK
jgi:hypothetical protein